MKGGREGWMDERREGGRKGEREEGKEKQTSVFEKRVMYSTAHEQLKHQVRGTLE